MPYYTSSSLCIKLEILYTKTATTAWQECICAKQYLISSKKLANQISFLLCTCWLLLNWKVQKSGKEVLVLVRRCPVWSFITKGTGDHTPGHSYCHAMVAGTTNPKAIFMEEENRQEVRAHMSMTVTIGTPCLPGTQWEAQDKTWPTGKSRETQLWNVRPGGSWAQVWEVE